MGCSLFLWITERLLGLASPCLLSGLPRDVWERQLGGATELARRRARDLALALSLFAAALGSLVKAEMGIPPDMIVDFISNALDWIRPSAKKIDELRRR